MEFGKYAKFNRAERSLGKPETFDFLGFTFYCSLDKDKKFFRCKVKTSRKKLIRKIKTIKAWDKENRNMPVSEQIKKINQKLSGHYQYYGVTDNSRSLYGYLNAVKWILFKWLNRRSQKGSYTIDNLFC
jgi:RNA-directed DNA polymerase